MILYVVGNPLVEGDNLPLRMMPRLREAFCEASISIVDPNENFIPESGSIILDSVDGINRVTVFADIEAFVTTKSVTGHDYDLGFHLKLLMKLKKITSVTILGIPCAGNLKQLTGQAVFLLSEIQNNR